MIPAYLSGLGNHLWQSTVFAAVAGLLTLGFRNHRAGVRYGLWLAASVKFLVPFSLLLSAGSQIPWRAAPAARAVALPIAVREIGEPFAVHPFQQSVTMAQHTDWALAVVFAIWFCGFAISVLSWVHQWRRIRAAVREASPLPIDAPIPVLSSTAGLEPGVFGIRRPCLLLPEGIAGRLTPAQMQAILAHELCHVGRRDNLTAGIHLLVESLFWFYPLLRWIRTRLVLEREQACDEAVLRSATAAADYAEGLLAVCRFYLESPLICVAGVTGSDLNRRIDRLLEMREPRCLRRAGKTLLTAGAAAFLVAPIFLGMLHVPLLDAQAHPELSFEVVSIKLNQTEEKMMDNRMLPGGRLSIKNLPLWVIIADAYGVSFQGVRLTGGPEWTRAERYDIDATAPQGAITTDMPSKERAEKKRAMLQSLLADRFKLKIRRETRDTPVYALSVARGGPKLKRAAIEEKDCNDEPGSSSVPCHGLNGGQGRGLHGNAATIADILRFIENWTDRPTVDRTDLQGLFEIDTEGWVPLVGNPNRGAGEGLADPLRPTLFMVFEKLGLKLEAQKGSAEFFVIESIEKPTAN
jgi:uncharacterized protein (TIGR03435 family)